MSRLASSRAAMRAPVDGARVERSLRASAQASGSFGFDALDRLKWEARFSAPAWGCAADLFLLPALLLLLGVVGWAIALFGG